MNYKRLLVILLATSLLVQPVFAFVHPPPPPIPECPEGTFAVKIEGQWCYETAYAFNFTELEYTYCSEFTVEVLAYNVSDLYGYEFNMTWDTTYFALDSWVVATIWEPQYIVSNTTDAGWFKIAVVAMAPAVGVTKDELLLVTFTFHIVNDVCWPQGIVSGEFLLEDIKASDSCTVEIELCGPLEGYWNFIAAEPEVYIEPDEEVNCIVGDTVTYSVVVHNITKMKSLHFDLRWKGNHISSSEYTSDNCEDLWFPILNITEKDVVINEDVFPEDNRSVSSIKVKNIGGKNKTFKVVVDIVMECDFPLINGTELRAVDLTFTKMDPWYCGRQPNYTRKEHVWTPENATTPLWFHTGYIDVMCPEKDYITFGEHGGVCVDYGSDPCCSIYEKPASYDRIVGPYAGEHTYIQGAIKAASSGETIIVRPGTYEEGIIIDKPLSLYVWGPAGSAIIDSTDDSKVASDVTDPTKIGTRPIAVYIQADNVTISGFTIKALSQAWPTPVRKQGVGVVMGGNNLKIECNTIEAYQIEKSLGSEYAQGMEGITNDTIISYNCITTDGDAGIELYGLTGPQSIRNLTIIHNTITVPKTGWCGVGSCIGMWGNVSDVDIEYNNLTGSAKGVSVLAYQGEPTGIEIHWNSIVGQTEYGVRTKEYAPWTAHWLNATFNWWGDRFGPGNRYPYGTGSKVSSKVYYDPWISCCLASYNEAKFTFMPTSGDLTGDGKVDIEDLTIICIIYGETYPPPSCPTKEWRALYYYDFDKDGDIDIFDIIVVTKNFGAECTL